MTFAMLYGAAIFAAGMITGRWWPAQVIPLNRKSSDDECQLCEANWPIRCVNHVDGW